MPLLYGTESDDSSTELEEVETDNDDAENERGPLNTVMEKSRPMLRKNSHWRRPPSLCHLCDCEIRSVKEKWTYPRKNVLVCAWHAKVKMAALMCFKNSWCRILMRPTRCVQRSKPIKKTDSRSVRGKLKCCGWRETIYPADWKRQFRRHF